MAHHFTEARLIEPAIPYWQRAGQHAMARSAHVEAMAHLRKGLALLQTLPDTLEHAQQELTLSLALSGALIATKGYAASEVEHTFTRAHALCEKVGDSAQRHRVLSGLYVVHVVRAQHHTAQQLEGTDRITSVCR